jgi:hypothetical protein
LIAYIEISSIPGAKIPKYNQVPFKNSFY